LLAAAGIMVAVLVPVGSEAATAAPAVDAAAAVPSEYRYTTIVAGKKNVFGMNLKPTAKVTDTLTGAPLAGLSVVFYLRNNPFIPHMCGGITNAQGVATCGGVREQMYVWQKNGYIAQFGGKEVGQIYYRSSSDEVTVFGS
jgi:hypothetical protein